MDCTAYLGFENVGQGLFYRGIVNLGSKTQFSFVYDCGSISREYYLQDAITSVRDKLNRRLDILIISHFHEDHVNGVTNLIKGIHVRKLVLPYINWVERLTIYLATNSSDQNYNSFITDPISFLSSGEFEIDEIIVVGAPDEPASGTNLIRPNPIEPLSSNQSDLNVDDYFSNQIGSDVRIESIGIQKAINPSDPYFENFTFTTLDRAILSFYSTPFAFSIIPFWEFQFYLLESGNKTVLEMFQEEVEKLIKKEGIIWRNLFDQKYRERLRGLYKKYYGNLNQTSLITYHAPTKEISIFHSYNMVKIGVLSRQFRFNIRKGTLLTGDIKMTQEYLLNQICNYFSFFWQCIGVFLIPHHGAKANWNFKHPNDLENFELYVVSSGLGRRNHPSIDVLEDIYINCNGEILHCTEITDFYYHFKFEL